MAKSKYKVTQPETMTYEQAVATALRNARQQHVPPGWWADIFNVNYDEIVYAQRRLRVRAGLTP
jgi:hypothetical protein